MRTQLIVGLSLLLSSSSSLADENAAEGPEMQVLYDEAIRLMSAGDYAKACPMIERVTQMAPDGLGAKITLGECYEEQGKLANAYTIFAHVKKAAQEIGQTERSQKAASKADALRPKLAQITFTGPQSLASEYGLRVEIDGVSIESSQLAEPRYVDPGTHHIIAFVKDERRNESTIDIAAGAVEEMSIRELLNLSARELAPDSSKPSDSWGNSSSTLPTWDAVPTPSKQVAKQGFPAWSAVVGGLGLVAIGVGAAFKLDSVAAEQKLLDNCGEDLLCPRNSYYSPYADNDRKNRGYGLFLGMTGLGAVALGTAAVGIIHWRLANQTPKVGLLVQPSFSSTHAGVIFLGRF